MIKESKFYEENFDSPENLADSILKEYKNNVGKITFPINPFKILNELDVKIVVANFSKLEGLFSPSKDIEDIDLVAINNNENSNIYRQRFTAAHEICHVIKDRNNITYCNKFGQKNNIEKFADNFAAFLLMPTKELNKQIDKITNGKKYIKIESIINISEYFGVSFESCVYQIAYHLKRINGDIDKDTLKKRIGQAKPKTLRKNLEYNNEIQLKREFIDSIYFGRPYMDYASTIKFRQYLLFHENRLEGNNINEHELNYIMADLRLNNDYEKYSSTRDKNIIEAIGNIEMIEYVLSTEEKISVWKISKLQKILYKYTRFGKELPFPRQANNRITGAEISTVDYHDIPNELLKIDKKINMLLDNKDNTNVHEYILECLKIHHRLTVIHPLEDGNGRCLRAFLIWLLRAKGLPPIYYDSDVKNEYKKSLNMIDKNNDYNQLEVLTINQMLKSISIIDKVYYK